MTFSKTDMKNARIFLELCCEEKNARITSRKVWLFSWKILKFEEKNTQNPRRAQVLVKITQNLHKFLFNITLYRELTTTNVSRLSGKISSRLRWKIPFKMLCGRTLSIFAAVLYKQFPKYLLERSKTWHEINMISMVQNIFNNFF